MPPFKKQARETSRKARRMILFFSVKVKDIFEKGRDYPWPRPEICPCCGRNKPWGHGYFLVYFDEYGQPLELKRYRCPNCGCVIRLRPDGYFSRFQSSIKNIRSSISQKIKTGRWPRKRLGDRQGNWLRALRKNAAAFFEAPSDKSLIKAFDCLISLGYIPVSRFLEVPLEKYSL